MYFIMRVFKRVLCAVYVDLAPYTYTFIQTMAKAKAKATLVEKVETSRPRQRQCRYLKMKFP